MKPSERAKQLGFKTLKDAAKILGVTSKMLEKNFKANPKKFDDLLIGAKHKLTMYEVEFFKECSEKSGMKFEDWLNKKDEI